MEPNETDEVFEIVDMWEEDGVMKAHVRYASGLDVVRTVKSVSLEGQITRADGTVEPKKVLAVSHQNPITEQRMREQHSAGKVHIPRCE